METLLEVRGMVLHTMDLAEYDKRLVLLTQEYGKITVFARGVRRSNNRLAAVAQPFCMGTFTLMPGRDAYALRGASVQEYFREMSMDILVAAYGAYFLEFASMYSHENVDGTRMLNLLYVSLKALLEGRLEKEVIRLAFEVRAMADNGEFPDPLHCSCCRRELVAKGRYIPKRGGIYCHDCFQKEDGWELSIEALRAMAYFACSKLTLLYRFEYQQSVFEEVHAMMVQHKNRYVSMQFRSLSVLDALI